MENRAPRQYYLDWLRVIAILVVFLYHCSRFFDSDYWHVKNHDTAFTADLLQFIVIEWMMPLFFFISGASTWYALQAKAAGKFAKDRIKRIFVPLLFGIFILSPHQVYLERLTHGQFQGSFIGFLPHYFDGWYAFGGNFAWMGLHCWYLLLLLLFSFGTLPLLLAIKKRRQRASPVPAISSLLYPLTALLLLSLPAFFLPPDRFPGSRLWGGWSLFEHLVLFLLGYYAFSRQEITATWSRYRYVWLTATILLTALNLFLAIRHIMFEFQTAGYFGKILLRAAVCLAWIFTLMGFAEKKLNYTNATLRYTNEAVLPFYILHQPVIILVGYFVIQWHAQPGPKFLVIVVWSFSIVAALYAFVVKRNKGLRYLHGMA